MAANETDAIRERIERFAEHNPDASAVAALGQLGLGPDHRALVEDVLGVRESYTARSDNDDTAQETGAEPDSRDANPGESAAESDSHDGHSADESAPGWESADFTAPEHDTWATDRHSRTQWMGHVEKKPFAPWADRDHPEADADEDARWKWGLRENYVDGETIAIAEDDHRLDGRAFLQRETDPFAYVDGDDVRDPETGDVHPAFLAVLDRLGLTYADISQSGGGAHAVYRGELPEGMKQEAAWPLGDEPWGANDDLPSIEIYAGKRVCVATGEHVPGTPTEAHEWDDDSLYKLLDENDQLPEPISRPDEARETFDLEDYDPTATESGESTDDIRDLFAALDRLDAKHVADQTIVHRWNDDASTSDGTRAFYPTWGKSSNGTANIVDDQIWQDTGDEGGYGGPVVMALIDAGEMSHRSATPRVSGVEWWRGIEHLRGLGYGIPELDRPAGDDDGEPTVVLPELTPKARARSWGSVTPDGTDDDPTVPQQELYDRVHGAISDAMERHDQTVIDAIMGGGKTFNFFRALATRGEAGAYFSPRIELYEQAVDYAEANGLNRDECYILPSLKRDCPVWRGEHGPEQERLVKSLYALGVRPKTIHSLLNDKLGCCKDGKCEYEHKCDFDPDDYQLLIGHYTHAHLPHVTSGRHCAFDEDPSSAFTARIEGDDLIRGVNAFLDLHDSPGFDGWNDLIEHRNDPDRREAGLDWYDEADGGAGFDFDEPDERNAVRFRESDFHALAPHAVYAILSAEPLESGYPFERASMPGLGDAAQFFTTSEEEGKYHVEFKTPPDLTYANAIIALDGTPLVHDGDAVEWESALDRPLNHRQVLTDEERALFLTETQGNVYVQSSPYIKPYSSGRHTTPERDAALLAALRDVYGDGDPATVFTDKTVCEQYEDAGFEDRGLAETFDYPGNLRGSDEYGDTRLGVQLGSSHHGDHELRRRAAWLGETVAPEGRGVERDYGSEIGNAVLHQMREAQTAQNALRVGRDGNGALFVLDTCAYPDWMPVEDTLADVSRWTDTEHTIRETWGGFDAGDRRDGFTTSEVTDAADGVAERQVRHALSQFAAKGYLSKERDPDDGRRVLWVEDGLGDLDAAAPAEIAFPDIDLSAIGEGEGDEVVEEVPANSVIVITQNHRNRSTDRPGSAVAADAAPDVATDGGAPPPDPAD